jgi:hypothetical protein
MHWARTDAWWGVAAAISSAGNRRVPCARGAHGAIGGVALRATAPPPSASGKIDESPKIFFPVPSKIFCPMEAAGTGARFARARTHFLLEISRLGCGTGDSPEKIFTRKPGDVQ